MEEKLKTKEEVVAFFQNKGCSNEEEACDDWFYWSLMVDVCDIYDDRLFCTVTKGVAILLQKQIAKDNTRVYQLGDVMMRGYAMRRFVFRKGRFVDLKEWSKKACLIENPNIFGDYEKNFSPRLKTYINQLRKGEE